MADEYPDDFPYVDQCPKCVGTGHVSKYEDEHKVYSWGDAQPIRTLRSMRLCPTCNGRGSVIPARWIAASGTSARRRDAGGSSGHSHTHAHGSRNT